MTISSVPEIIAELRAGRMVVLIDEEDRENEGDLVLAAEFATPEAINFMVREARGLVCLTLTSERCEQLELGMMTARNGTAYGTNFTVSIEAAEGVTTGISAADRAHTIRTAVAGNAVARDLVQPGHIFPVRACEGGVLMRAGHTEAGCDLTAMADLTPAAVICEILNEDGSMARLPDLEVFAQRHGLKIGTIADLIQYRSQHECILERVGQRITHTVYGDFQTYVYRDKATGGAHLALVHGKPDPATETVVRVHQPLSMLDLLETGATNHSWTVAAALQTVASQPCGVVVLLNCEESADQMVARFHALDAKGSGTVPGRMDLRMYGIGAQILKDLNVGRMTLLASPKKMPSMQAYNLDVVGYLSPSDPVRVTPLAT